MSGYTYGYYGSYYYGYSAYGYGSYYYSYGYGYGYYGYGSYYYGYGYGNYNYGYGAGYGGYTTYFGEGTLALDLNGPGDYLDKRTSYGSVYYVGYAYEGSNYSIYYRSSMYSTDTSFYFEKSGYRYINGGNTISSYAHYDISSIGNSVYTEQGSFYSNSNEINGHLYLNDSSYLASYHSGGGSYVVYHQSEQYNNLSGTFRAYDFYVSTYTSPQGYTYYASGHTSYPH